MEAKEILAYCAGLFDGEGCIHIARIHTKKRNLTYQLICKVSMCSLPVLVMLKKCFGGSIRHESKDEMHNKYGLVCSWAIFGKNAVAFLNQIKPYLWIKKPQAELAIEFQGNKSVGADKGKWGNVSKSEEALAIEESQYILMRNLKKEVVNV